MDILLPLPPTNCNNFFSRFSLMRPERLLIILLVLILSSCSGGGEDNSVAQRSGGTGDEKPPTGQPIPVNYWEGVDFKDLPSENLETVRLLEFTDGIGVEATYREEDNILVNVCRVQIKTDTSYKVCLQNDGNDVWSVVCLQSDQSLSAACTDTFAAITPPSTSTALKSTQAMSDDHFCNQGDPVEGNPSLQCKDGWGFVAFKGEEGYAPKRICRLHRKEDNLSGRCFDGVKGESGSETAVTGKLQTTTWKGYRHDSEDIRQSTGVNLSLGDVANIFYAFGEILKNQDLNPVDVENAPDNNELSFSLPEDDTDCTLNKNGVLTGVTAAGECPVTLLIQAPGFVDKAIISTVTVKNEQNATWEGFPGWMQYRQTGETISPGDVANEDGTVEKIFTSSEPSRCLIDQSTGVLTVAGEGSCEISLTLRASGFMTKIFKTNIGSIFYNPELQKQLNPLALSNPYGETPALAIPDNTSLALDAPPTGKGAISYRSTYVGVCEVDAGTGAVSAIGPGNCLIHAQAAGDLRHPPSVWTEVLNIKIISTLPDLDAIVGFAYSSLTPKLSDPTPTLTVPTAPTGAGVSLAYSTTAQSTICTVSSAGVLSMTGPGDCPVTVVATKAEHNPSSATVTITISEGEFSTLTWASFPSSSRFGTNQVLGTSPASVPAADSYTITHQSGACTWDNVSKELAFTGTGDCVLSVSAEKIHYTTKTENFTVAVSPGSFSSIVWSSFPASAVIGETSSALDTPASIPVFESHSIAKKSGDCTWNNTTKTISFTGITPCVLTVTVTKTNYENGVKDFSVTPGLASITVANWGNYGDGAVGGADVSPPSLTDVVPAEGVAKNYQPLNQTICTVNSSTGVVTPILPGTCRVRLTLSKTEHNDLSHEYSLTINPGTQSTVVGFSYSSLTPKLSDNAPRLRAPSAPLMRTLPTPQRPQELSVR